MMMEENLKECASVSECATDNLVQLMARETMSYKSVLLCHRKEVYPYKKTEDKSTNQSYDKRIKSLQRWVYSKSLNRYENLLIDLAVLLQTLLPQEQVKLKQDELDAAIREKLVDQKLIRVYELLCIGICLLHQPYRMYEDHHWLVEREDQLLAFSLLQPRVAPGSMISSRSRRIYLQLQECFYPEDFTIREASYKLRIARTTLQRHMMALENGRYIERVGGDKKKGYKYNVSSWPWEK